MADDDYNARMDKAIREAKGESSNERMFNTVEGGASGLMQGILTAQIPPVTAVQGMTQALKGYLQPTSFDAKYNVEPAHSTIGKRDLNRTLHDLKQQATDDVSHREGFENPETPPPTKEEAQKALKQSEKEHPFITHSPETDSHAPHHNLPHHKPAHNSGKTR